MHPNAQKSLEEFYEKFFEKPRAKVGSSAGGILFGLVVASVLQIWLLYLVADNLVFLLRAEAVAGTVVRHHSSRHPPGLASGNEVVAERSYIKARLPDKVWLPEGTEIPLLWMDGIHPQARIGGYRLWYGCRFPFVASGIFWVFTFLALLNAIRVEDKPVIKCLLDLAEWIRPAQNTVASCIGARIKRYYPDRAMVKPQGNQGQDKSDLP